MDNYWKTLGDQKGICYSGYRRGHSPDEGKYPSYDEISEDLNILKKNWSLLRLYDSGPHAETVLEVIEREKLPLKVMLGTHLNAERSNPSCPWGAMYSKEQLINNIRENEINIERMIRLANSFSSSVFALSVGNEAIVDWSDHLVPAHQVQSYTERVKKQTKQPVTYCENYVPWRDNLYDLAQTVDFISLHTYPVWEYKTIEQALDYTKENYYCVKDKYPDIPVVITEAGWTTVSNGRGIEPWNANESLQSIYYEALMDWTAKESILTFLFEAFDEEWKGSSDPMEPEKHWGLFTIERKPKMVLHQLYSELL